MRLLAYGFEPRSERLDARDRARNIAWNRAKLREIDLRWHDLRHEGDCRLYADGADIRTIQLMLGHSTLAQTQRYLNITDEEMRRKMEEVWTKRRVSGQARGHCK